MNDSSSDRARILIVDDDPTVRKILSMMLSPFHDVRTAHDITPALEALREVPPDLILLDVMLPSGDGYDLCRTIRNDLGLKLIPVIFLSSLQQPWDKVRSFEAGGTDYITKPFQLEEILVRVETHLKNYRRELESERERRELKQQYQELSRKNLELGQMLQTRTLKHFDSADDSTEFFEAGAILDSKYRIDQRIGSGGFGVVYQAHDLNLQRPVALKILHRKLKSGNSEEAERLRLEGISVCRINHPNAVSVLDFVVSESGFVYLVMELLEGETLLKELQRCIVLSLDRCAEILVPLCRVLIQAHDMGIVHRDIKPDNIFLHRSKDGETVKVIDFGLVKLLGETDRQNDMNLTLKGKVVGTPTYMSPERLKGKSFDGRSDVYSVGVLAYQMLGGKLPFESSEGEVFEVIAKHLNDIPPPLNEVNSNVPLGIEEIVLKALRKRPETRPTSREFLDEFLAAYHQSLLPSS